MGRNKKSASRTQIYPCSRCRISHARPVGNRCQRAPPVMESHMAFNSVECDVAEPNFTELQGGDTSSMISHQSAESDISYKDMVLKQQALVESLVDSIQTLQNDVSSLKTQGRQSGVDNHPQTTPIVSTQQMHSDQPPNPTMNSQATQAANLASTHFLHESQQNTMADLRELSSSGVHPHTNTAVPHSNAQSSDQPDVRNQTPYAGRIETFSSLTVRG